MCMSAESEAGGHGWQGAPRLICRHCHRFTLTSAFVQLPPGQCCISWRWKQVSDDAQIARCYIISTGSLSASCTAGIAGTPCPHDGLHVGRLDKRTRICDGTPLARWAVTGR